MIRLGLSIYEEDNKDDEDLPALAESNEAPADNKMEEVDWYNCPVNKIILLLIRKFAYISISI